MDLVVRTPHGDADLTVVSWVGAATLAELVELATGQAAPPLVHIDGRPVVASTALDDAPLLLGSVVSSHPHTEPANSSAAIELMQLTGRGAGATRTLDVGRYRVGPGRRRVAGELGDAPVDTPMFELIVDNEQVTATPMGAGPVSLGGRPLEGSAVWSGDVQLRSGSRVFAIEPHDTGARPRRFEYERDGTIQFSRAPQMAQDDSPAHLAHAVRTARLRAVGLWRRRTDPAGTVVLPFGLADEDLLDQPLRALSITIDSTHPAAVTGSPGFRDGVARTLLVEATTRYGPADLALAVATRGDRLGEWDWAKWLPHLRWHGGISLLSLEPELLRWVEVLATSDRTTLLVVDDASLWSRNDSPFRDLIAAPPANLLLLALADRVERAPAATSSIISQDSNQRCRLVGAGRSLPVLPAVMEADVAAEVARSLAPLRDAELAAGVGSAAQPTSGLTLAEAFDLAGDEHTAAPVGTATPSGSFDVALGATLKGHPMRLSWKQGTTWSVAGPDPDDVATTVLAILLSVAVDRAPDRTPLLLVSPETSPIVEVITRLPHFAGRGDPDDADARARMMSRLSHRLDEGGEAVVVVESFADADQRAGFLRELRELASQFPGLWILDARSAAESDLRSTQRHHEADIADVEIVVDRRSRELNGFATSTDGTVLEAFVPFSLRTRISDGSLSVRPFVFGRTLSPLERRLERGAPTGPFDFDEHTASLIDAIVRIHGDQDPAPQLVPTPLPGIVVLEELLESHEADAVPIGLADDPTHGHHDVVWWQPGSGGSMLFVGTARAGLDVVVSTLTVGIGERFAPSDLQVYAIDGSTRRLGALQRLPHSKAGAALDRLDRAAEIIDVVAGEVVARRFPPGQDGPDDAGERPNVLLLISDLTQLGRRLRESPLSGSLDRLVTAASGAAVGVNIVAIASRASDSCGLADVIDPIFVGALSSAADALAMGFDASHLSGLGAGRCRRLPTGQLVQLASTRPGPTSHSGAAT
jgi:DNA segregation ATPase FtsK/SpoIIIE, S-DNA-T family